MKDEAGTSVDQLPNRRRVRRDRASLGCWRCSLRPSELVFCFFDQHFDALLTKVPVVVHDVVDRRIGVICLP